MVSYTPLYANGKEPVIEEQAVYRIEIPYVPTLQSTEGGSGQKYGLDPTDEKQRRMATAYLLEKVSWTGMSEFKAGLTASRTRQLCDAMTVTKDLMANLLLSAGGRGGVSTGGGGSNCELTNGAVRRKRLTGASKSEIQKK